jgi:hypothetical protein
MMHRCERLSQGDIPSTLVSRKEQIGDRDLEQKIPYRKDFVAAEPHGIARASSLRALSDVARRENRDNEYVFYLSSFSV